MQVEGQRVHELADELGYNKQELVSRINDLDLGFTVSNFMTRLNENEVRELKEALEQAEQGEPEQEEEDEQTDAEAAADEGIGPTVIRRNEEADEEEEDEEAAEAEVGGVVRRRGDDEEEQEDEAVAEAETPDEEPEEPAAEEGDEQPDEESDESVEEADEPDEEPEEEAEETDESEDEEEPEPQAEEEAAEEEGEPAPPPEAEQPAEESGDGSPATGPEGEPEDGAEVTGRINQDVIQDRLAAEGKDFGPEEEEEEEEEPPEQENERRSRHRTRQVVEGNELYDGDSRGRRRQNRNKGGQQSQTQITEAAEHKRVIEMEDVISVGDLAKEMGVKAGEVAMKLLESGMNATVNTALDYETATLIADEYGYSVENVAFDISDFYDTSPDPEEDQEKRAPVVTVMGHVDHGKTSLLDAIRESDVQAEETGGITQHIGAYQVDTGDGTVTFLDTPGHEAFTALRARGAKATDIVVLVVAADDGVMPQTVEAINHAQDAEVPIVVAINKIDKETANPDRIKQALTEYELVPEEWGGTTLYTNVSALERENIDELLESIQLQSEIEEFRANPERKAQGLVIESELDTGRGPVATVLVQRGTLHDGDILVSGQYYGSVRTMHDDRGRQVQTAGPSVPVEITGLDGVPEAGEPFFVVGNESDAQRITEHVEEQRRKEEMADRAKEVSASGIEDLSAMIQEGDVKELKVIIKGDVQGSVEALREAFEDLSTDEARVQVIHSGVGAITENDVNLAASSETAAVIIGFNVRPDRRAAEIAEKQGVEILTHSVIYDAVDQVKSILEGLLEPITQERSLGRAEVREIFTSGSAGTIAGCYVTDGKIDRNAHARVLREGRILEEVEIASLKRFEEDVNEVREGYECGLSLEGFNDIEVGDEIEIFDYEQISATLGD